MKATTITPASQIVPSDGARLAQLPTTKSSSLWRWSAVLIGVVGIVVIFRSLSHADWPLLFARVGPFLPVLVAIALGWMALYARGLREILDRSVSWGRVTFNRVIGEAYNVVIPFGDVGGDPLRILDLESSVGAAAALRAIVLDHLVYVTSGFIFSALTSLAALHSLGAGGHLRRALTGYVFFAVPAALVLSLVATRPATARLIGRVLRLLRVDRPDLPAPLPAGVFARALGWNLLGRAGVLVEIGVLLVALGQPLRPGAVITISALLSVAGIVFFFVPGGLGVNEGAAVLALTVTGYGDTLGLTVGLARRVRQLLTAAGGVALNALCRPPASSGTARPDLAKAVVPETISQHSRTVSHGSPPTRGPESLHHPSEGWSHS